jgi:hypothetical protein
MTHLSKATLLLFHEPYRVGTAERRAPMMWLATLSMRCAPPTALPDK